MVPDSRQCTKCAVDKPLSAFSRAPRGKYGVKASCKACDADRHARKHPPTGRPRGRAKGAAPDPTSIKTCRKCGESKPRSEFSLSRRETAAQNAVYRSCCKSCSATQARQWFADNADRASANRRRYRLSGYGLTLAEYNAFLRQQNGVCAVCGKDEPAEHGRTGKQFRLAVDHCHETGVVRGLLCQKCNRAIGLFSDNPVLMRKAISYLLRHRKGAVH